MRIGWLADTPVMMGGAELSNATLLQHKPEGIEIVPVMPGDSAPDVDIFVVQNCTNYDASIIPVLATKPVLKQVRDFWTYGDKDLRSWLLKHSTMLTFSSPLHVNMFQRAFPIECDHVHVLPVPVDPAPFLGAARATANRHREGVCWFGPMHSSKGIGESVAWAEKEKTHVDFYGDGPVRPREGPYVTYRGWLPHSEVPAVMATHQALLFTPLIAEPFGRVVLEAALAGCQLLLNEMVGASYWINEKPHLAGAGIDLFWKLVDVI